VLEKLGELAEKKPEEYQSFWHTFGRIFKEGYSDFGHREKFQDLLRFNSSRNSDDKGLVSLAEYVTAMPEGQKGIYYLSGASREALLRDPRLELFRKRGIEVLYLDELADEFVLASIGQYKEHKLISADQVQPDDLKELGGKPDEPAKEEESKAQAAGIQQVIDRFKEVLGERVLDVRASQRLVDSPACLVSDDKQMSGHMDRMMRMMNKTAELPKRVLELNPQHPLVQNLEKLVVRNAQDELVKNACEQLFEGAMLVDGYLTDPHQLVERMNQILAEAAALKAGN
jgi:molecular chaperone HtpG